MLVAGNALVIVVPNNAVAQGRVLYVYNIRCKLHFFCKEKTKKTTTHFYKQPHNTLKGCGRAKQMCLVILR